MAVSRPGFARSAALFAVIMLCVALPRAGRVMPGLRLPLPAGLVLLHAVFWPTLLARRWTREEWGLVLRFAFFGAAVLFSAFLGIARGARAPVVVVEVATLLGQVPAFFVAVMLVRSASDARAAIRWLALAVAVASAYGVALYYIGPSILLSGWTYTAGTEYSTVNLQYGVFSRTISTYGDPNVFATALAMLAPGLCGYVAGHRRWTSERALALAAVGLALLALVYCNSRAGYLGIAVGLAALVWRFPWRSLWIMMVGLLVVWVCAELGLTERISDSLRIPSSDPRSAYPRTAGELLMTHPEGGGLGIQLWPAPRGIGVTMAPAASVWEAYNSSYLHMLARVGVVGLGAFLWLSVGCAAKAWRGMRNPALPPEWQAAVTGLIGGYVGAQIGMLTNPFYQLPGGGVNLWLGLGLAFVITRVAAEGPVGVPEREPATAGAAATRPAERLAQTGGPT